MHYIAIIDIGSNSVRLVIYRLHNGIYELFYNEKNSCRLGDLDEQNRLKDYSKQATLETLLRFAQIIRNFKADIVQVVATAALRDAVDGLVFSEFLSAQTGLKIEIISGTGEALLSAKGVKLLDNPQTGMVADLGGGSLELMDIATLADDVPHAISVPLGVLRLQAAQTPQELAEKIAISLAKWHYPFPQKHLYCVGGSWRALALAYLYDKNYPVRMIQGCVISSHELCEFLIKLQTQPAFLQKLKVPAISKKRLQSLPVAGELLDKLIQHFQFESVSFSMGGIREGVLYDYFTQFHPAYSHTALTFLKAKNQALARFPEMADILYRVMKPLFFQSNIRILYLLELFCYSSDLVWQTATDHRAETIFDMMLYFELPHLSHQEKLFLAYACACRYQSDFKIPESLLNHLKPADSWLFWAKTAGMMVRYLYTLTGINKDLLAKLDVQWDGEHLAVTPLHEMLPCGQNTTKRYENLCKHLGTLQDNHWDE